MTDRKQITGLPQLDKFNPGDQLIVREQSSGSDKRFPAGSSVNYSFEDLVNAINNSALYGDTAAGIAGTSDGEYFITPSPVAEEYAILYLNDSNTAVEQSRYPSSQGIAISLAGIGYEFIGDYAAGIEVTAYNQVIRESGEFWRAAASTSLPYTTTGAGMPEGGAFVNVGDAVLRQELGGEPSTGQGATLVNGATVYVGSVAELETLLPVAGQQVTLSPDRQFKFSASDLSAEVLLDTKQVFYVAPDGQDGSTGAWVWDGKRKTIPIEWAGGSAGDSSASARTANEEALQAIEAFNYQPELAADSEYYFGDTYDLWQHRFVSGRSCSAFIGAAEYNVSNAVWGIYRIDDFLSGTNNYITLRNARDNIVIGRIARGDENSASHVFQLPLDIRRDSHSIISQPGTVGGSSDWLFRDSDGNDTFYFVNDTTNKNLKILFNTTLPPAFNFDEAISIPTETSDGIINVAVMPMNFTAADFTHQRSRLPLCKTSGGNRNLGVSKSFAELPFTEAFIRADAGGGTYLHCSGIFEVSVITNTGVSGRRRQYFEWTWNGSVASQVQTDEVNTLPAGVTATTTAISGDRFGFSIDFDETAGSGTDCRISARVDFSWSII